MTKLMIPLFLFLSLVIRTNAYVTICDENSVYVETKWMGGVIGVKADVYGPESALKGDCEAFTPSFEYAVSTVACIKYIEQYNIENYTSFSCIQLGKAFSPDTGKGLGNFCYACK